MKTSSTNTSIIATQRWEEFKNKLLVVNDPKLEIKIRQNWGESLNFISRIFY